MKFTEIEGECPLCGEMSHVALTEQEYAGLMKYRLGGTLIQKALPKTDPAVREFAKGACPYCHDCMELLFGNTSDRIRNGEAGFIDYFELGEKDFKSFEELFKLEDEATAASEKLSGPYIMEYHDDALRVPAEPGIRAVSPHFLVIT